MADARRLDPPGAETVRTIRSGVQAGDGRIRGAVAADGRNRLLLRASGGGIPPRMAQRNKEASPGELESIKERMKQFGLSDERINEIVKQIRGNNGNDS